MKCEACQCDLVCGWWCPRCKMSAHSAEEAKRQLEYLEQCFKPNPGVALLALAAAVTVFFALIIHGLLTR